ncbi:protein snail [Stomoxys calcitrans]|uniref:C2H2-type domain-containing protein n=1 Tax=Stomoxys calcitrans TaxID=35570 RepID=A0A1I8P4H5_STOCA|nr:protein snail [Stomoxys calcitrans]
MATNYKSCPLKKRPIIYVKEEQELQQPHHQVYEQMEALALTKTSMAMGHPAIDDDQPQDLSLKRKASDSFEDYVVSAKRECVLNLSSRSSSSTDMEKPVISSPIMDLSGSSAMLSPPAEIDSSMEYQPSNIHLRGLTANTSGYTTNPYQSAFVMAAGCNPMTALWNTYQPNISAIFPSPASSVASAASPRSNYSYQHITPPSSPGSEMVSEPEDLSVRNDIPLPALFHMFDETPSHCGAASSSFSSASSVYSHSSSSTTGSSASSSSMCSSTQSASKNYRFKCEKCNKMYSTSMGLSKHQQFHCPAAECNQEKKQHSCQDCGKLYTTMGALKMHIRTHTLPCKCPICGKAFSRPWLLQGHIRTHTGEKPFQCPDCPRSFADRSNLRAHQQTHVDVKKYACKVCNKSFSRMSLLNKHASSNCTITIA